MPATCISLACRRSQLQADAGGPVHLAPEAVADDGHVLAHPLARQNGEIVGRADAHRRQALLMPPTDAPHIAYREFFQRLHTLLLRIDDIEPPPGVVRLGELVGGLGQYFRRAMPRQIGMPIPRRVVRMISRPSFSKSKPSIPVKSRKASSME